MTKFFDATLFPHADIPGVPRVGRFHPQTVWHDGYGTGVTETLPTHEMIARAFAGQEGRPIYYWDEMESPIWDDLSPSAIQATMDRRADLLQLTRDVVGPGPRLLMPNFPVYGDTALRNLLDPNYYSAIHAVQAVVALRAKFDIVDVQTTAPKAPTPSRLYQLLGGAAVELYWTGQSAQYIDGVAEFDAFAACVEMIKETAQATGLKVIPFVRLLMPDGQPVPMEACRLLKRKFDELVVWEGEEPTPPKDAPMLKLMN